MTHGALKVRDLVTATVDASRRNAIRRNHTATHLLHWALRTVLGDHVKQQGSMVAPDRLRFDFSHFEPVTPEQIAEIEDLVNHDVLANEPVRHFETTKAAAADLGAIAFFGDKYGDRVRVLRAGPSFPPPRRYSSMPSRPYAHARGLVNSCMAGSAAWKRSSATERLPTSGQRAATVPNAQQLPQLRWFLIGVRPLGCSRQSKCAGNSAVIAVLEHHEHVGGRRRVEVGPVLERLLEGKALPFPPAPQCIAGTHVTQGQQPENPVEYWWTLRALLVAMDHWVRDGKQPPASRYPRLADGTLVAASQVAFPKIPGVT